MVSVLGVAPFYELITELALFSSSKLGNGDNNLGVFRPGTQLFLMRLRVVGDDDVDDYDDVSPSLPTASCI